MCLQKKKKKGLGRQASEPGGKDGGWTISHSLVGTQSWKFLVEIGGEKKTFFKPLEGISVQTMLDPDRVLKELQGVRKATHIPRAFNSPFPRGIYPSAIKMLHPDFKLPWHFLPASQLPTRPSPLFAVETIRSMNEGQRTSWSWGA